MDIFTVQQDLSNVQDTSTSPISALITTNTSIASVEIGNAHHIRVYFQDTEGCLWETEYRDGTRKRVARIKTAFQAKSNTPLAAITYYLDSAYHIRLFYVDMNHILREHCWDQSLENWSTGTGTLGEQKIKVDHRSKIAACVWREEHELYLEEDCFGKYDTRRTIKHYEVCMRVYYQAPHQHGIYQIGWYPKTRLSYRIKSGWGKDEMPTYNVPAVFGSGLAAIYRVQKSAVAIYYQHALDRTVRELSQDQYGNFVVDVTLGEAVCGTAIAAITWRSTPDRQVRVYYEYRDGVIVENGYGLNHVQAWSGPRRLTKSLMGASLSSCCWSSGSTTHIRVYLQQEEEKVLEYCGIGEWVEGAVMQIAG